MSPFSVVVVCCFVTIAKASEALSESAPSLKTLMEEQCREEYSATCLKMDVATIVPSLSSPRSFRLLSSLIVEMGGFPVTSPNSVVFNNSTLDSSLDRYIVKGMDGFINSLALRVKVVDKSVSEAFKKMGITLAQDMLLPDQNSPSSRDITGKKKNLNHALVMGGMVSAGTLLALTMSAVSTLAGKAILVSLISLLLSLLSNRGSGSSSSGNKVSYEVVHTSQPQHDNHFTKTWRQSDLLEDSSFHHLAQPVLPPSGIKRMGVSPYF